MIREVCILIGFSVLLLVCANARTRCAYIIHNADFWNFMASAFMTLFI